jgi:ABC-type transporter Mla subunit MlaD
VANPSGVTIQIGGNSQQLQQAVQQANNALNTLGKQAGNLTSPLGFLGKALGGVGSAFGSVVGHMANFIDHALQITTGIGLYNFFDTLAQKAKEFGGEMFDLNNTMERYQTTWQYLFGTGNNPQSAAMAAQMAQWTKVQSYNYPFTRQDMLGAMNSAGMATQDPALIEKYMSTVADLASTRTDMAGNPVTLQGAMMSLVQANMGYSRMLKYDLKINPEDLKKLGWNEKSGDFANLLAALAKYNKLHNLTGASQHIATSTWYGEKSSFEDRIQNFQLEAGHQMFETLKGDLNDFTSWWDAHQHQIDDFAIAFGTKVAGALKAVGDAGKEFFSGWTNGAQPIFEQLAGMASHRADNYGEAASGGSTKETYSPTVFSEIGAAARAAAKDIGDFFGAFTSSGAIGSGVLLTPLRDLATWLANPAVGKTFHAIGKLFGDVQSKVFGTAIAGISGFFQGLSTSGVGPALQQMVAALDKLVTNSNIGSFFAQLGSLAGSTVGTVLASVANAIQQITNSPDVQGVIGLILKLLGAGIGAGLEVAGTVLSKIADFIGWVASHQAALDFFLVFLSMYEAYLLGGLIEAIVAWGIATWDAVAANIALYWPVYLVVAAIGLIVTGIVLLVQHWKDVVTFFGNLGGAIKTFFTSTLPNAITGAWNWVKTQVSNLQLWLISQFLNLWLAIQNGISSFGSWVSSHWNSMVSGLETAWATFAVWLASNAAMAWNNVTSSLGNAKNAIGNAIQTAIVTPIGNLFNTLVKTALTWGADLIANIWQGIKNGVGALFSGLQWVAGKIAGFLGHSVPKEGPLVREMEWMPHMMQNLADSMLESLPIVERAVARVAATMGQPFQRGMTVPGGAYAGSGGGTLIQGGTATANITMNAATEAQMERVARRIIEEHARIARGASNTPGGYRAFGVKG